MNILTEAPALLKSQLHMGNLGFDLLFPHLSDGTMSPRSQCPQAFGLINIALSHSSWAFPQSSQNFMPLSQTGNPTWGRQSPNSLPANVFPWVGIIGGLEDLKGIHS